MQSSFKALRIFCFCRYLSASIVYCDCLPSLIKTFYKLSCLAFSVFGFIFSPVKLYFLLGSKFIPRINDNIMLTVSCINVISFTKFTITSLRMSRQSHIKSKSNVTRISAIAWVSKKVERLWFLKTFLSSCVLTRPQLSYALGRFS